VLAVHITEDLVESLGSYPLLLLTVLGHNPAWTSTIQLRTIVEVLEFTEYLKPSVSHLGVPCKSAGSTRAFELSKWVKYCTYFLLV
jgi:hypothetical protein